MCRAAICMRVDQPSTESQSLPLGSKIPASLLRRILIVSFKGMGVFGLSDWVASDDIAIFIFGFSLHLVIPPYKSKHVVVKWWYGDHEVHLCYVTTQMIFSEPYEDAKEIFK